jgi:sec-independent protein translocase protein TatC
MPLDQLHEVERQAQEKGEMSFFEHISELRKHILRAALAIMTVFVVAFINIKYIFEVWILGPKNSWFPTYHILCDLSKKLHLGKSMCFEPTAFELDTREMGEILMQYIYVSFWLGIICAFPYILWEIWRFVSPGLHESERKAAKGVIVICTLLFFLGVLFGYFIIAPFSISFLASYTLEGLEVSPTLDSYVTYMTMFTLPMGLIFELPVMAFFLAKIGVVGAAFLRNYRRHAAVIILIIAAIITPPDVVSQTLVSIPLFGLYEASILVVARVQLKREKALKSFENKSRQVTPYEED